MAQRYADPKPVQVLGFEARVLAAIQGLSRELGKGEVSADSATQAMARDVCLGLVPDRPPPSRLVNFAMESNGLVEPPPHFVVADMPPGGEPAILEQLQPRLRAILARGDYSRAGVAVQVPRRSGERRRLLVALLESRVRLDPLPRRLGLGEEATVRAAVSVGITRLRLVVAAPDGKISTTPMEQGRARFGCLARGTYQVELTGEGKYGVEVLANFPVYCDQDAPGEVTFSLAAVGSQKEGDLERAILLRTNQLRLEAGLTALRPSIIVAALAREHSLDMRDSGFVGHVSPVTGTPTDRLRKGGVTFLRARENVARGYGVEEIMSGLMNSPAHRGNLLSDDVSEVGVGVAIDRTSNPSVLLVTQDFIAAGTAVSPSAGEGPVLAEITRLRQVAKVGALKKDEHLSAIARRVAGQMAAGDDGAGKRARQALDRELDGLGQRFKQVDSLQARLSALEALARAGELTDGRYTHVGVGVSGQRTRMMLIVLLGVAR